MRWAAIQVACPPESEEPVAACFTETGCAGVVIHPGLEWATYEVSTRRHGDTETIVIGYLPVDDRLEGALDELRGRLASLREYGLDPGNGELTIRLVEEADWAEAWKAFYRPLRIGRTLVIKPSWETFAPSDGDRVIELDPGMAFGTGAHPTTQLCLALLEERVTPGDRVLDLGCGSGILALAAARVGASDALALDLDPIAVAAARENARVNGLADLVQVAEGSVEAAGGAPYDLVVANILADVIIDLAPDLARLVRDDGLLIASGIIADRTADVAAALVAAGFRVEAERAQGEWRAVAAGKDKKPQMDADRRR